GVKESKKKYLTNPRKTDTIRISISYRSVPGKRGPEFVRSADLQSPPHKWHGFRILTHNPEVSGSNPLPATFCPPTGGGFWFSPPAGERSGVMTPRAWAKSKVGHHACPTGRGVWRVATASPFSREKRSLRQTTERGSGQGGAPPWGRGNGRGD
ncbi:MAG: hypothetical protein AAGU17_10235, partial [Anaerolineaceae bacterium]